MEEHVENPQHPTGARRLLAQLAEVPPGRVRTWFAPDVVDTLAHLETLWGSEADMPLLAVSWPPGADIHDAIENIVTSLAGVALARWPDWYGEHAPFAQPDVGDGAAEDLDGGVIDRIGAMHPALNRAWARQAVRRCRRGERLMLVAFPPAVQVQQLMLALAQPDLILLLALESEGAPAAELLGFARTAAWVAGETGARVAAFVPAAYRESEELDAISYGAGNLGVDSQGLQHPSNENEEPVFPANAGTQRRVDSHSATPLGSRVRGNEGLTSGAGGGEAQPARRRIVPRRANDEPLRLVFPPILGRPHPSSPGEQLLAQWLARDGELRPLFAFNQRVESSSGESFVADLLWRAGKMVVEVDGYGWHSSPHAFAADRHRDYRLLCGGYRTLRLPHDEVMDDPALHCEKIRDVVHAIQKEETG